MFDSELCSGVKWSQREGWSVRLIKDWSSWMARCGLYNQESTACLRHIRIQRGLKPRPLRTERLGDRGIASCRVEKCVVRRSSGRCGLGGHNPSQQWHLMK
jgi:hypothetical protein